MQDLKIALAQVHQVWEDKAANLEHFEQVLAGITADLILLPEMFQTGFTMNGSAMAEQMDGSSSVEWLKRMAAAKQAAVYTSLIIRENGQLYNRGVFVEPSGTVHSYDKRKVFGLAGEHEVYTSGSTGRIVTYKGWKINLQICYDLRFPENIRNGIGADGLPFYDLLLYVANWPEKRSLHWDTLLRARAIENQCYVAGVNRVGTDANDHAYAGGSAVYSALGEQLAAAENGAESVITAQLSGDSLQAIRKALPFLNDSKLPFTT